MKLAKYRAIDLTIFAFIACFLEIVCLIAQSNLNTYFFLSLSVSLVLIAMVRWNAWSLILAALLGIVFGSLSAFINKDEMFQLWENVIVYGIGNCFIALDLAFMKLVGKKRVTSGGWWLVLFAIIGQFSVCLGRSVIAIFFGDSFIDLLVDQLAAESLNFILAIIILFITNKQENMLRDQKEYFSEVSPGGKDEK